MSDNKVERVKHPNHYTIGKYETIDVIEVFTQDLKGIEAVCIGNIIKYVSRANFKNGLEDIEKAVMYFSILEGKSPKGPEKPKALFNKLVGNRKANQVDSVRLAMMYNCIADISSQYRTELAGTVEQILAGIIDYAVLGKVSKGLANVERGLVELNARY